MRINAAVTAGAGVWLGMDAPWPGSSTSAAVVNLFFAEYILPATVRSIVSVKHEEKELNLRKIDAGATFDEVIPRPYDRFDDPTTVAVGGLDIPTYEYTGGPPEPGLRMIVWPAPKEPVILRYSYYYEHPRLVNATDALVGVPASIVEDIVRIARADAMSSLERDVVEGLQTESMARKANNQKWKNSRPSPATRYTVHGWGTGRRGVNVRNGFPGVTIEE
jgi:hypothetical protein